MNKEISIVLIAHKSKKLVINFIKNLYDKFHIIVVDNSNDTDLQNEIKTYFPNIIFNFMENRGYGAAVNFANKFVKTKYFLVSNPDVIGIDISSINKFYDAAIKLNNQFSIIGPIDLDHKAEKRKNDYDHIELIEKEQITGICMFINKVNFDRIKGFDENIFLYFEDNDLCLRSFKINKNYQINTVKVHHKAGTSVTFNKEKEKNDQNNLRIWHFIWSKFYYYKKHFNFMFVFFIFIPVIIRIVFRIVLYSVKNDNKNLIKYKTRWSGLLNSILGKKSFKRV